MVAVEGFGLHTGAPVRVGLSTRAGAVVLRSGGLEADLRQLSVGSTERGTTVHGCDGRLRVATVEHAFAALAGLGIRRDVLIEVDGPELPLLDGASLAWCGAFSSLGVVTSTPPLRVARSATVKVGASRYELTPGPRVEVEVLLELEDARIDPVARWEGDADDFLARIAPARTFARVRDLEELARGGLARHVPPESVVLLAPDAVHWAGRPFTPSEPARHKLLDLVGDSYLYGGPPVGRVRAIRPGHRANAIAFTQALAEGILSSS